jgi:hypothetical protein
MSSKQASQGPDTNLESSAGADRLNRGEILRVILMTVFIVGGVLALHATPWGL